MNLLFGISYGLYVLSVRDGEKDNGCMINTLLQQTSTPERLSVTVNKANLTHDMLKNSGVCSVSLLSQEARFELIKNFGMSSGKVADKFANVAYERGENGVAVPIVGSLGYFELKVVSENDLGTHTMFLCEITQRKSLSDALPMTYAYYQSSVKPKPQAQAADGEEVWVCKVCGYVHKGPLPANFVCPICKHGANDFERQPSQPTIVKTADTIGAVIENKTDTKGDKIMAKYVCSVCGYVHEGDEAPEKCPVCKAPKEKFIKQEGEMSWAAEHVIGVADGAPEDVIKDLRANFDGECCEVGMYLAMSRAAFREGYAEIGLYWEKAAFEEAEHAAKFAELLGEKVSASTKKNLEVRVEAENGATMGKTMLAKRAKELGLDAIHDTVHEMARDEARHGKAFAGFLKRYFG